ncbi:hypothetical protein V2J09_008448 [Rumex salicifolius]
MEKFKMVVNQIAYSRDFSRLSLLHRSLIPFLSIASSIYKLSHSVRLKLYRIGFIPRVRLPVPVISVGNLTWGGNGKTPMVEFLALWFASSSISPLVLSRGYAGGDEVKMLQRHFLGTRAYIGVGANRAEVASSFLLKSGCIEPSIMISFERHSRGEKVGSLCDSQKVGLVILDDGMQHLSLMRDVEIVMVNGLMQFGNNQLLPLGPLREPLTALDRADIVVIHHADLIPDQVCTNIDVKIRAIKESLPIYLTRMKPSHFFMANDIHCKVPLSVAQDKVLLCVSAIGSPDGFAKVIKKLGPLHIDRLDFSDHHLFQSEDILMIKSKIKLLENRFSLKPVIIVTEKDYDRDPDSLLQFLPYDVLVLCSRLQFMPKNGCSEESFKILLKQLLNAR